MNFKIILLAGCVQFMGACEPGTEVHYVVKNNSGLKVGLVINGDTSRIRISSFELEDGDSTVVYDAATFGYAENVTGPKMENEYAIDSLTIYTESSRINIPTLNDSTWKVVIVNDSLVMCRFLITPAMLE